MMSGVPISLPQEDWNFIAAWMLEGIYSEHALTDTKESRAIEARGETLAKLLRIAHHGEATEQIDSAEAARRGLQRMREREAREARGEATE